MKSRISFFNKTVFKKDVTRFAPLWSLYTVCLVLGMMLLYQDGSPEYGFQQNLTNLLQIMNMINFAYAAVVVQMLFGDLYNSRMCNALHALPIRRECWFGTHTVAGLSFSIVPSLIAALLAAALDAASYSFVTGSWQLPWWNLLGMNLQYLFYFALALFCAMCVGSRFAQLLVYGIVNFASVIAYWLVDTLYTPMFYGLQTVLEPFVLLSPAYFGCDADYFNMEFLRDADNERIGAWIELVPEGWMYVIICAVIGVLLLAAALLMYRRRKLESAGDFMAVKAMEPIFMVVFPLVAAGAVYFFTDGMLGMGGTAYLAAGLVIGFIAGRMLLERTTRVFSKKNILGFLALAAAFGATFLIVKADPLGWEGWIPAVDEVAEVKVYPNYYGGDTVIMDEPEEIEQVLRVHEIALADRTVQERAYEQNIYVTDIGTVVQTTVEGAPLPASNDGPVPGLGEDYISPQAIKLEYHLTDGSVRSRYYVIDACDEAGDILIPYFSNMEMLFGDYLKLPDREIQTIADATLEVRVDDGYGFTHRIESRELILQLLQAIEADCEAGVMAQNYNFRTNSGSANTYWLYFDMGEFSESLSSYTDCENINEFLLSLGIEHRYFIEIEEIGH